MSTALDSLAEKAKQDMPKNTAELLEVFISHCHKRRYPARLEVVQPGDPADTLYYIADGSLSILMEDDSGQEIVLAYLNQGDFLGEMGVFITLEERNVYAKTRSATVLAEIGYNDLHALLDGEMAAFKAEFLMLAGAHLARRLMKTERKVGDLALLDVTGRIARAFLELAQEPDSRTHPLGVRVSITRAEMARIAGCSREMAGRCMKDLESRGFIISEGRTVIVKDKD